MEARSSAVEEDSMHSKLVADRYLKRELLGEGTYGVVFKAIDTKGTSDIDQLGKIFAAFGTPRPSQWPEMEYCPDYLEYQYFPAPSLRSLFPMASDDALDLLSKMFTYDPKVRISSQQVLEHRYFSSFPAPTKAALLSRPPPKGEYLNQKTHDLNLQDGPVVPSPLRKMRKVTVNHVGFEGDAQNNRRGNENEKEAGVGVSGLSGHLPMSIDLEALFGLRAAPRPKLDSADRSHLKRKLDMDPEFE